MTRALKWILAAAVLTVSFAARAEVVERPYHSLLRSAWNNSLTVNPIDLFTGTINLEYERAIASRVGFYGGMNFLVMRGVLLPSQTARRFAIGPELGVRIYLIGRAPGGIWLGPYVNAAYVRESYDGGNYNRDNLALGAGGMGGVNLLFGQFNLSLGAGAGYTDYAVFTPAGSLRPAGTSGLTPRLRLAIGAVF